MVYKYRGRRSHVTSAPWHLFIEQSQTKSKPEAWTEVKCLLVQKFLPAFQTAKEIKRLYGNISSKLGNKNLTRGS